MNNTILKELNVLVCNCGVLLQLDNLKQNQYDPGREYQSYECPACLQRLIKEV